jgi:diaminohydroxyphosphoribosylaminopyrimidine deaminase/5-amino-6-(5-phosphoribosylamino)uracil reductase
MQRALNLAVLGAGSVSPNPLVGCVIVKDGKVIGEGWHKQYGEAHAEVNAINSVQDHSLLKDADLYVTLEPCSHFGKTPPCANLIIKFPFRKVYVAMLDSNPLVQGRGIDIIRNHGIEVEVGLLKEEAIWLNRRFLKFILQKRPYVILKWAETSNKFMAPDDESKYWISNDFSKKLVHRWRAEEDAILIGTNTAIKDKPSLTTRLWEGKNPQRILIDRYLKVSEQSELFQNHGSLIYNCEKDALINRNTYVRLNNDAFFLPNMLDDLWRRNIQSVIVEGGYAILNSFIKLKLWDEARIFSSHISWARGLEAPILYGQLKETLEIDSDVLKIYLPTKD